MINIIPALGTILEIAGKVATTANAAKSIVDSLDNTQKSTEVSNIQQKQQISEPVKNVEVIDTPKQIQQPLQPSPVTVNLNVYVGDRGGIGISSKDDELIWLVKREK